MADYISQFTGSEIDSRLAKVPQLESGKQDKLVSGSNIKTLNGESILGSGDITIQGGDPNAVKYTAQTLTDAQKAQARTNIAAASAAELGQIVSDLTGIEADIDSLEAAVEAINVGDYVTATTLPTASASTMGHIYLIGPDANNNYDRYFTQESSGTYSWVSLGSTQIDLSTYATQEEVSQLEAEVHNLSGKYYGIFASSSALPEGDAVGYAFVGIQAPFAIYQFNGTVWANSGATVDSIQGEPGIGFEDMDSPTPADGSIVITLSNGDTMTLDLNHNHTQYSKAVVCQSKADYDAIVNKDSMTFYVIPGVALYFGNILVVEQAEPTPYTPVDYIQTDGDAYIDTGIIGNSPRSCELIVKLVRQPSSGVWLGARNSATIRYSLILQWGEESPSVNKNIGIQYNASSMNGISASQSVDNGTPIVIRSSTKPGEQVVSIKQQGDSGFSSVTSATTGAVTTGVNYYLFRNNYESNPYPVASGGRVYACKIYSDADFYNLVFDGVPCIYNGEYGLWNKVNNTFHGNANSSGAFTGPNA